MAKRKIKRKEIKRPDEFITFSVKVVNWCSENLRILAAVAAGVVLFLIIVGAVVVFKANREAKARELYQKAIALYPAASLGRAGSADYAKATATLEEVQKFYGSTIVATTALVDLGNIYFLQGEYDKSISCYNDFLQQTDLTHPMHDQVLESLGGTHEAKGALQAALDVYQRLASEGAPVYQNQAQLYLGRVYEAMGDKKKAMNHYDNYLNGNPAPLFGEWLRTKLRRWRQVEKLEAEG